MCDIQAQISIDLHEEWVLPSKCLWIQTDPLPNLPKSTTLQAQRDSFRIARHPSATRKVGEFLQPWQSMSDSAILHQVRNGNAITANHHCPYARPTAGLHKLRRRSASSLEPTS
jgi:hypothetical protein